MLLAGGEYYELGIALQGIGFNQGLWSVVVGRFAVRTTPPFSFSAKPVASTMRSGVIVVILLAKNERSRLSLDLSENLKNSLYLPLR